MVGEASDGTEAVALAAETTPEVILMDIRMPGMNGMDATERILATAADPAPRILVLTTFDLDPCPAGGDEHRMTCGPY